GDPARPCLIVGSAAGGCRGRPGGAFDPLTVATDHPQHPTLLGQALTGGLPGSRVLCVGVQRVPGVEDLGDAVGPGRCRELLRVDPTTSGGTATGGQRWPRGCAGVVAP